MEDNKKKKRIFRIIVTIAIIIPIVLAISYAYFQAVITGEDAGVRGKSTNTFEINLVTENDGYINASNLLLIKAEDVEEEAQKGYFKVVSGNNKHYVTYTLSLSELTVSANLQVTDFKWQLLKNSEQVANGTFNGISTNSMNLVTGLQIGANKSEEYELRIWIEETEYDQLSLMNGTFAGKITLTADMNQNPVPPTLAELILGENNANVTVPLTAPGKAISTAGEAVLASTEDDYGTSYYFRGAVTNNYVLFADMCWRIVRVNGDGSIKLVLYNYNKGANSCSQTGASYAFARYSGTTYATTFNASYNQNAYVGFKYGTPGSGTYAAEHANTNKSTILTNLETWYTNNLASYESKLADSIWCNDKSTTAVGSYGTLGYGTNQTGYALKRLGYNGSGWDYTTAAPTLKCSNDSSGGSLSRFTVADTANGNGNLTYKIGLLTVDEATYAGGMYSTSNSTYYLNQNATDNHWWSLSPYIFNGGYAFVWIVYSTGHLGNNGVNGTYGLRPAVSLNSTTQVTGVGTSSNPYVVL